MSGQKKRRAILILAAVIVIALMLFAALRFALVPGATATMVQHTFGDDISISISGFGTLSNALLSVYIFSGDTSLRAFIINVRIASINYHESFPYSASVTLPSIDIPQTVEVQTFFDDGDFQFLRTHQNVGVRILIAGAWSLGSTSLGATEMSTDLCCIQS